MFSKKMDADEIVKHLGATNGRYGRPMREEEMSPVIPYFQIKKNDLGRLTVNCYNYEGHDNEPRMELYREYLQSFVLPNIAGPCDICGFYPLELHDSYTYLDKPGYKTKGLFTFSKFKSHHKPVLIPDPYMVSNWGNTLGTIKDTVSWENKADKACFFGTTTGCIDPHRNKRINLCYAAVDLPMLDCKITKVAQIPESSIVASVGAERWNNMYHRGFVSPQDQMQNKFLLCMDGNTCRFDVWNYFTNSMTLKSKSMEMLWYYPILSNNEHFVQFDHTNIKGLSDLVQFLCTNPSHCKRIVDNANQFAFTYFKPVMHMQYMVSLMEAVSENK